MHFTGLDLYNLCPLLEYLRSPLVVATVATLTLAQAPTSGKQLATLTTRHHPAGPWLAVWPPLSVATLATCQV